MHDNKRNIKLVLQYDGTDYCGFQHQARDDRPTIQSVLEEAIRKTTGEQPKLIGSGRTDAGVHALGQVVNFATSAHIPIERMAAALNSRLPADIAVIDATEVPLTFHSRYSATRKTYVYTWYQSNVRSPFWFRYALFVPRRLDVAAMAQAAQLFVGRHDFAAFSSAQRAVKTTVRHVYRAQVEANLPLVRFIVEGDGFLYHMVRIMAGTLGEVGSGKRPIESIVQALRSGRRSDAGITAPAHGLALHHVDYDVE